MKNSGGTLVATYKWDGQGRRVEEIRGSTTTDLYYSDQWQVLEERVGGVARLSYAWSPVYEDALIARDRDTDANGSLDERLYTAQDANFNVTALLSTAGAVVERFQYDPFGKFSVLDGAWSSRVASSYGWNYLHQGGRWDADGGVYSFRNRELSPTLGRWLQMDPIGFAAGDKNLYGYLSNNGVGFNDPMGQQLVNKDRSPEIEVILKGESKNKSAQMARLIDKLTCPLSYQEIAFLQIVAKGGLNDILTDGQVKNGQIENIRVTGLRNAVNLAQEKLGECMRSLWKPPADKPDWCSIAGSFNRGISGLGSRIFFDRESSTKSLLDLLRGAIREGNREVFCKIIGWIKNESKRSDAESNERMRKILSEADIAAAAQYSCS